MKFYFLREDFEKLGEQIVQVNARIREIGREMGQSCQEGAETFHDNFAYEDGERQQRMWSLMLQDLVEINRNAEIIVPPASNGKVAIGSLVTLSDIETGEEKRVRIGSYRVFENHGAVSYSAPLGQILLGAKEGDTVTGVIAGKPKKFAIVGVE
jgi:transcription elongation GreA/GreB family factor